ncbi:MAG: DUF1883 domain-containing protein [Proteobacteria bacterium]|nr:DUF1883 domain-containing protein [Pseudomonadota bacterium]
MSVHAKEYLNAGDVVIVNCDHQCNVLVMDDSNFNSYRNGSQCRYFGGFFRRLPARVPVPHSGNWNVVVDAGQGQFRYSIQYMKRAA